LADDVAVTKRTLAAQDGPVILAGHSYGGVVITEAGNDPKVAGPARLVRPVLEHGVLRAAVGLRRAGLSREPLYTPQLVVDGQFEAVGSDAAAIRQALLRAARSPKAAVTIAAAAGPARDRARVDVRIGVPASLAPLGRADVLVAIIGRPGQPRPARRERRPRPSSHRGRSRRQGDRALAPGDRASSMSASVPLGPGWAFDHLRAIAFLQERDTRRIIGAASARIAAGSPAADSLRNTAGRRGSSDEQAVLHPCNQIGVRDGDAAAAGAVDGRTAALRLLPRGPGSTRTANRRRSRDPHRQRRETPLRAPVPEDGRFSAVSGVRLPRHCRWPSRSKTPAA
jgi:hypothetical protein